MLRFQSKPLIGLCVWISIRGGFAVPTSSEFTYVGFGSVLPLNTVDAGSDGVVADTIMLIPAGTESSGNSPATTYLYSEVEQMTTISTGTSTTATLTISESVFGTLVASASGFALSATLYDVDPQGDNVGDEISCHYINSVDGECEQVNTLFTFATTGEAITGTLQESAPTSSGSGSGSNNGALGGVELNGRMLAMIVTFTAVGAGFMRYAGTSKKYKFSYYIWYSRQSRPEKITIIGKSAEKLAPLCVMISKMTKFPGPVLRLRELLDVIIQ
ncbi:hypothetical protein BT96DRAFT_979825 [Gymnopus androsaceus JB14]|uniref:Uncharacterized protein n=1 Tax=Gymnopus androsaceus JB14 TaxID=1447944 RepID=A0A6A4H269_9AGAR|nr:hypothetical protein BT96DRAFT_979825 [Gymnopus androsaceus JB14]